jgi:hypothetical protein
MCNTDDIKRLHRPGVSFSEHMACIAEEYRRLAERACGPEREQLELKARQAETALRWVCSPGLQPPT